MKQSLVVLSVILASTSVHAQDIQQNNSPKTERAMRRAMPAAKNIFAVSPVHITEDNVGIGLSLEHFLDAKGIVSLYLPVSYAVPQNNNSYYEDNFYYSSSSPDIPLQSTSVRHTGMAYFYPGIKIYPTGAFKKVSYALGCNLVAGFGKGERTTSYYSLDSVTNQGNPYTYYTRTKTSESKDNVSRVKLGVMVSNSLNIRASEHFYVGLELGLGYTYLDKTASVSNGSDVLAQAGIKFGFVK